MSGSLASYVTSPRCCRSGIGRSPDVAPQPISHPRSHSPRYPAVALRRDDTATQPTDDAAPPAETRSWARPAAGARLHLGNDNWGIIRLAPEPRLGELSFGELRVQTVSEDAQHAANGARCGGGMPGDGHGGGRSRRGPPASPSRQTTLEAGGNPASDFCFRLAGGVESTCPNVSSPILAEACGPQTTRP